jgi:hypothetical protein
VARVLALEDFMCGVRGVQRAEDVDFDQAARDFRRRIASSSMFRITT